MDIESKWLEATNKDTKKEEVKKKPWTPVKLVIHGTTPLKAD